MIYQFDHFQLDIQNYRLLRDGKEITIEPLIFDLIRFLVENRKRVVSRDEIKETLWPKRLASDASLSNAVNGARKALVGTDGNQEYIKTIRSRGYQFIASVTEQPAPAAAVENPHKTSVDVIHQWIRDQAERPRVAVLPFVSQNLPTEEAYIASGLFDDTLSGLCGSREIQVISSLSVLYCEEQGIDMQACAAELNIDYIVQGSIARLAHNIILNIRMMDTHSNQVVLAEKYPLTNTEMMTLDNHVVQRIVNTLIHQVRNVEYQHLHYRNTSNYRAYDYYLRGMFLTQRLYLDIKNVERASAEFGKALDLDPEYGRARAMKARLDGYHHMDKPETIRKTIEECELALSTDPQDSIIHQILGLQHLHLRNFDLADYYYCQAMRFGPSDNFAYCRAGNFFTYTGEYDKAEAALNHGLNLSPIGGCFDLGFLAILQYNLEDYDSAIENVKKVWHPDDYEPMLLAVFHAAKDEWTEARKYVDQVKKLSPHKTASSFANREPYKDKEKQELIRERLIKAGMDA